MTGRALVLRRPPFVSAARQLLRATLALGVAFSFGCMGNSNPNSAGGGSTLKQATLSAPPSQMPTPSPCTTPGTPGPRALRRLTNAQIANTIAAVTGDPNAPSSAMLNEGTVLNFLVDADFLTVQDTGAQLLMTLGESLGTYASQNVGKFAPCQTTDSACRKQVVDNIASMFFHGNIPADRLSAYEQAAAQEADIPSVVQFMVAAAIQSPYFVYRRELGTVDAKNPGRYNLDSYEIADEISYQLTNAPPDSMLAADAAAGALTDPAKVSAHVSRLLAEPAVQTNMVGFFVNWLELNEIESVAAKTNNTPNLTPQLRDEILQGSTSLISETWNNKGGLADILNSNHTFINNDLAQVYGMNATNGNTMAAVPLQGTNRGGGVLFEGAFLASHAAPDHDSPVQRGVSVLRRLLCQTVPPPPPGVPALMPISGNMTTRQLYEDVHSQGTCKSCHDRMQGVGFLFENYDTAGKYRTMDNNLPVDANGIVTGTMEGDKTMVGNDLAPYLASLPDSSDCMAVFWTYATFGRAVWPQNECTIDAAKTAAAASGTPTLQSMAQALYSVPNIFTRTAQ